MFNNRLSIEKRKFIVELIEDGVSYTNIKKETGSSYNTIKRISKECGIYEKFIKNNKKNKKLVCGQVERIKSIERYKETDKECGKEIEEMILKGFHMVPILKRFELKQTYFHRYLLWKSEELREKLRINGREEVKRNCLINSKKASEKMRGKEIKKITKKAERLFLELKENGIWLSEISRQLKKIGFGCDKVKQLCDKYGKPEKKSNKGVNNNQYGKEPSERSGIGAKGWVIIKGRKVYFRSSLEMKIFIYLKDNNIEFSLSKHRIPYINSNGIERTYCPDIVICNTIYEIKPQAMINVKENGVKMIALKEYCKIHKLKCEFLTEETYDLNFINKNYIERNIKNGELIIDEINRIKIYKYL